jgi:hypothetical protein
MVLTLTKTYPRLWSIEEGNVMVVTDLHGDWDAYRRYRDCFVDLRSKNQADWLVFSGDLIHSENPAHDNSLEIVLDVLDLQAAYGQEIIYLSGNHELPHIYGINLAKGKRVYTPEFEKDITQSQTRERVISLFDSLPFYVRTKAGVSIAHSGAPALTVSPDDVEKLFNWSHQTLLEWADNMLAPEDLATLRNGYAKMHEGIPYDTLARYYLAVTGSDDPRYNDLLRGFIASSYPTFDHILWAALFTRCEKEYGLSDYTIFLDAMLQELSTEFFAQQFLVAGHITLKGGYEVISKRHLRLASAHHATPREAGQYLLFDAAQPLKSVNELLTGLDSVFR